MSMLFDGKRQKSMDEIESIMRIWKNNAKFEQ